MSNEPQASNGKKPAVDLSGVSLYIVIRNNITKVLSPFAGKRGAWDGKIYQAPQIKDETFDTDIEWIGKSNVKNFLNTILRRVSQDYVEDSTDEKTGIFNEDLFLTYMKDFAAAGLKLAELKELYFEKVEEFTAYIASEEFQNALGSGDTSVIEAARTKVNTLKTEVNGLKGEMEARSSRRSKEANTETVTPE